MSRESRGPDGPGAATAPVAIVGAGITGLALGRELARRGVPSVTLEAAERPGGILRSPRAEGRVLEMGPQRTRLVPAVERLVRELGLRDRLLTAPEGLPLFVYVEGKLRRVPLSLSAFLATDLFTWRGRLRMLAEPFTDPSPRSGETVASYVTRTLGREAYERLIGPLYGGIYGSDPADMLVEFTLGRALRTVGFDGGSLLAAAGRWMLSGEPPPPAASFRGGMQELTDALYEEGAERIRLGTPAIALRRGDGGRWRVATGDGPVTARRVVLTCGADAAAELLAEAAPGAAGRLSAIRYNPLAVVHLSSDAELHGFGYQVAASEGFGTRGVTYNASLFDREDVVTAYLGGASAPGLPARPDGEVGRVAVREFRQVTGADARVLRIGRTRMPAWDRSRAGIEGMELPGGVRLCASYESRPGIPGRLEEARRLAEELAGAL